MCGNMVDIQSVTAEIQIPNAFWQFDVASFSAYTMLRDVFFILFFCFMFVCLHCATCRGE